jgi:hypothetical protein
VHQGQRVVWRELQGVLQGVFHWRVQMRAQQVKGVAFVTVKDSKPVG